MHPFAMLFLSFLALSFIIKLWLAQRHIKHIAQHRYAVPAAFREKLTLTDHQKAADYTTTKVKFGRWVMLYSDIILLLLWTFGGGVISGFLVIGQCQLFTESSGHGITMLCNVLDMPLCQPQFNDE